MTAVAVRTQTFEEFYRVSHPALARTLANTLGDQELASEAADEAMSRAFQRWTDVSSYANPQGWAFRTGKNWAISVLRRTSNGRDKIQLLERSESRVDQPSDPDLERALGGLRDDQRSVVWLRFYADWSISQIAAELGIPVGTVKSRLSRALRALRGEVDMSSVYPIGGLGLATV